MGKELEKTVNLSLNTLIRECSNNKKTSEELYFYFYYCNRENIHTIFRYKKFNDDFTDTLTCYNNGDYIIGTIRPSYDEFLTKLLRLLNVPKRSVILDNEELTEELHERIEVLKNIKTEEELKDKFPLLYKDLIDGRRYVESIDFLENMEPDNKELLKKQKDYYYSCALKHRLDRFIKTQCELYKRFTDKRFDLQALQKCESYNHYIKDNFDLDKVAMYTIHEYLKVCEDTNDPIVINKYLSLISKYLTTDTYKKDVSLTTDENIFVNIDTINIRYKNIKRRISDQSSIVNWIIIPEGRDYSKVTTTNETTSKVRTELFDLEELARLISLGERKTRFYEGTEYLVKAIGLKHYHGYIAYIYPNGEVILDTKFNLDKPRTATGNAIYNLKASSFETLSKLDKSVLRKHPKVGRIMHTSTWEERVEKIIKKEGTEEEKAAAKALVKKLRQNERDY